MAYNSTIDKATDDILIYGNTAKDGSGTSYVPLLDTDGHQQVDVLSNALPTGASTLAEQQTQTTALQLIDDTVYTDGAGTVTKGIAILGQDGTNPQAIKTDASGELQVDVLTMPTTTVTATDLDIRNLVNTDVVTAELSATDNAVLDAIAASTASIDTDTTTIIGHVDGLETSNSAIQTSVELMDDTVTAQGTALGTTKTILNGASVTTANPTYTTGQISPLNMATTGALRVDVGATSANATAIKVNVASGGIASGGVASGAIASGAIASGAIASGAIAAGAIAAGATSIATTEDTASAAGDHLVKVAQIRLDTPVSGANLSASGDYTQFIADSFGKTWVTGTYAEDLAHVAGEAIVGNGVRRIDTPATSAGTSGDWATMDASAEGALWTTNTPTTTGGCTIFRTLDLDETEEEVKATAGNVYGYYFYNAATSVRYLKFYNATAASVSVGTTTPVLTFPLPASAAGHISFGFPVGFATAICVAATTGVADADTGAPAANDVILNVFYK